jgi:hypothetical protein
MRARRLERSPARIALAALLVAGCARPLTRAEADEVAHVEAFPRQPPEEAPHALHRLWSVVRARLRHPPPELPARFADKEHDMRQEQGRWLDESFRPWWQGPGALAVLSRMSDGGEAKSAELSGQPAMALSFDLAMTILCEHDARAARARGVAISCDPYWGLELHDVVDAGLRAAARCMARATGQPDIAEECRARYMWMHAALDASRFNCDIHAR